METTDHELGILMADIVTLIKDNYPPTEATGLALLATGLSMLEYFVIKNTSSEEEAQKLIEMYVERASKLGTELGGNVFRRVRAREHREM